MPNSPLKGWFAWLWREALSCHLPSALLRNLQAGAKAQRGSHKESWAEPPSDWTTVTSALRHFHPAFPAHPGALQPAHTGSLWLPHREHGSVRNAGSKTQLGSFCAGGFAFRAWAVTVSFSLSWNSALAALWVLGTSLCASHTPFLPPEITPDPSWEAEKFLALFYSISRCGDNAELHFEVLEMKNYLWLGSVLWITDDSLGSFTPLTPTEGIPALWSPLYTWEVGALGRIRTGFVFS